MRLTRALRRPLPLVYLGFVAFAMTLFACAEEATDGTHHPSINDIGGMGGAAGAAGLTGGASSLGGFTTSSGAGGSALAGGAGGVVTARGGGGGAAGGAAGGAGSGGDASGGTSGSAGAGGSGGGSGGMTENMLSQGKVSSADSEEADKGNLAALGNDGNASSRWCAADGALGHYWQVNLGGMFVLTRLQIFWEQAALYQFKVEGSANGSDWSTILDETASSNQSEQQEYVLDAMPSAAWVKVTVTGLPTGIWASFFEFRVYGH